MNPIPLEDFYNDTINKVIRGHKLDPAVVAAKAGLPLEAFDALRNGEWNEDAARKVAPVLDLNAQALADMGNKNWRPEPVSVDGLAQFNTVFEDMTVNAYLVWDPATKDAAMFDTGSDVSDALALAAKLGLTIRQIFITHTHGDHIFDLDRLREKTGAPAYVGEREPLDGVESIAAGRTFSIGSLTVETRLTWGHCPGGITYVVRGLARPLAIVGDAVFASSMGGGGVSFPDALATNRAEIFTLPAETVICPGHGPLTSVGEELAHNPFYAGA